MRRIELVLGPSGHHVAWVEIPPFPDGALPDVVHWGWRTFVPLPTPAGEPVSLYPQYREAFALFSLTPSPGLPPP